MKESVKYKQTRQNYIKAKQQVLDVLTYLNASLKEINECLERDAEGGNVNGNIFGHTNLLNIRDSEQDTSNRIKNNIIPEIDRKIRELDKKIQECIVLEKQEGVYYE